MAYEKLKAKVKRQWLRDLRSGKFFQIEGGLRDSTDGRCCIGIYCHIVNPHGWRTNKNKTDHGPGTFRNNGHHGFATEKVRATGGLSRKAMERLANMNDGRDGERKRTFAEIADWIEANL